FTIFCAGAAVAISIPCSVATAVLRGLGRFDFVNALRVLGALVTAAATVIALLAGGGVLSLIVINIAATLVLQIPAVRLVHRIAPDLRLNLAAACRHSARSILSFSSSVFMSQLAGRLQAKSDELIIAAFLPLTAVTPYAMGRRL